VPGAAHRLAGHELAQQAGLPGVGGPADQHRWGANIEGVITA
jgi:hypothetical protein